MLRERTFFSLIQAFLLLMTPCIANQNKYVFFDNSFNGIKNIIIGIVTEKDYHRGER